MLPGGSTVLSGNANSAENPVTKTHRSANRSRRKASKPSKETTKKAVKQHGAAGEGSLHLDGQQAPQTAAYDGDESGPQTGETSIK